MARIRVLTSALLVLGLILGLSSHALAQITYTETGAGGCFANTYPGPSVTECAKATFYLMTGGTSASPGSVVTGTSASNVTGLEIVIQNTTPTTLTHYANSDLLTGFFWGLNGSPAFATTGSGTSSTYNGSAIATNSKGGNAILDPSKCGKTVAAVAACTGTSINVGAYWALTDKNGGWPGYPGAYVVSTSGYAGIGTNGLGQGTNIGANDPTLTGKSSLEMAMVGGAGSPPTAGQTAAAVQDTVTIQVAFASPLTSLNLSSDIIASDIFFTYGTAPEAASGAKIAPEPASIAIFGAGVVALGVVRRRRRRHEPAV